MPDDDTLDESLAKARTDPAAQWFGRRGDEWFEGEVKKGRPRADVLVELFGSGRAKGKEGG